MKSLTDEIVVVLTDTTYPIVVKTITDGYPKSVPLYPAIIVNEIDNISTMTLLKEELYSKLTYDIEIYAKDMLVDNVPTSSKDVVKVLAGIIDTSLNEEYGLTRRVASILPYNVDTTVTRYLLRYDVILDNKNEITFR